MCLADEKRKCCIPFSAYTFHTSSMFQQKIVFASCQGTRKRTVLSKPPPSRPAWPRNRNPDGIFSFSGWNLPNRADLVIDVHHEGSWSLSRYLYQPNCGCPSVGRLVLVTFSSVKIFCIRINQMNSVFHLIVILFLVSARWLMLLC